MSNTEKKTSMYENVMHEFNKAADKMNLDAGVRKILATTQNEVVVHFPVKMDDGRIEVFTGYRVQHNNALGPYKGDCAITQRWTSMPHVLWLRG